MHVIRQYQTAVTLFKRNGDVVLYPSMKAAFQQLGHTWIAANVGPHFRTFSHHVYIAYDGRIARHRSEIGGPARQCFIYAEYEYIMRSDMGDPLTAESFAFLRAKRSIHHANRQFRHWNGDGPVPGTGKPTGSHYFRNIRHVNAKRGAQHLATEGEISPRAKRTMNTLPDAWDDLPVAARRCRNWKRYRKNQYRRVIVIV